MNTADNQSDSHPAGAGDEHYVPVTVFVTVHAVDHRDARAVAESAVTHALRDASGSHMPPWTLHAPHPSGHVFTVRAHRVIEADTAARNGYLHIHATPAAYRNQP